MLFRKKIERRCSYCSFAGKINGEKMICQKRGIVESGGSCRSFRYDPLKRVPERSAPLPHRDYSKEDFEL